MLRFSFICIAALLLTFVTSCGTRRSSLQKELEKSQSYASFLERQQSANDIKIRELLTKKSEVETLEGTTVKEYALDDQGNSYLKRETSSTKKGTKKANETAEKTSEDKSSSSSKTARTTKTATKSSRKDKQTIADKTIVSNLGGWGVLIVVIILILVYRFFIRKK